MPITCTVTGCKRRDTKAMFTLPTKPLALNNWRLALKIPESQAVSGVRICFQHFPMASIQATLKVNYDLKDKDGKLRNYRFT